MNGRGTFFLSSLGSLYWACKSWSGTLSVLNTIVVMDLLASLKAEGLHEFANVWICFTSFQVSQLTCSYVAWKAYMFSWGRLTQGRSIFLLLFPFFMWKPKEMEITLFRLKTCFFTKSIILVKGWSALSKYLLRISENLRSEYHRGDWSDFLNSNWTFLGKSESQFSMISVQSDLSVGFWHFPIKTISALFYWVLVWLGLFLKKWNSIKF